MLAISALRVFALAAAFTGPTATPPPAQVAWAADPGLSNVTLSVPELWVAKVSGAIPIASARIVTTAGSTVPQSVEVRLNAAALDTHNPQRDAQLRSDKFFDVAAYPTITFASDAVTATGPRSFTIDGSLTMRGVTHPVRLDGHMSDTSTDAQGQHHVRYEATGSFQRSDYGMSSMRGVVGNTVSLDVVLQASDGTASPPSPA